MLMIMLEGNYGAAVNFDTTLPMIFSNVQNVDVRYFLDTANLWGVDYSSDVDQSNTIRASTGVVVDWFTPIGPLNFSLAQDISKADDDKTETFQFNLGTTFKKMPKILGITFIIFLSLIEFHLQKKNCFY